ncbi:hypothetical protein [Streptomyces sp. WZ-12]|uniref:hypothetical protein n=1 Tax=Streptomyces sp. WZ-12 TaxID=3030210 RepID=UPI0023818432|nr:hypothetical protein [Streptomyces sp. WZ-12]
MTTNQLTVDGGTAEQFLAELFEFEYCVECGGDAEHHTASPDMFGKWHAWCDANGTSVPSEPGYHSTLCGSPVWEGNGSGTRYCASLKGKGLDWCPKHDRLKRS